MKCSHAHTAGVAFCPFPCFVPQIGSIEVMDAVTGNSESPMLLVDVRSEEEVLVSTIPGAIHCPAEKDDSLPHGWWVCVHGT
eukprot:1142642-Pelagomonas_calceolata.AAC.18